MKKHELTNTCQTSIDQVMNENSLNADMQAHVGSCEGCQTTIATLNAISENGAPADYSCEFPGLKQRVLRAIKPIMKAQYAQESSGSPFSGWVFRLVFAGTALVLLLAAVSPIWQQSPGKDSPKPNGAVQMTSAKSFKISVDGKPFTESSIDNPVSLFSGETASIKTPDGSLLKVKGPTRLNVTPRGFHLLSGSLVAEVVKDSTAFIGTTPHGQIEVLGTVFSCDSSAQKTIVKVFAGKVKVTPDCGLPVILKPGDFTEMTSNAAVSSGSETIPSIDSE